MDVPTLMHNLREEVTCSVCIHLYKEPKQLPCLHIFCLECLNGLARTNARHGKIKCPLCQIEVAVPDSGTMETLPDCLFLKNLLDILAIKECNTSKVTCGNCDKKSDEASYCFHCSTPFWCKECLNAHSKLKENKKHRVLALKDFQEEDFEVVIKRPALCPKERHERGVLTFYCKVCEVPACQTCLHQEHDKHHDFVENLEITANVMRGSIASKLETAKFLSNTISISLRELDEQNRLVENHSQIIKQKIQETAKTLIQTLQQQERELIAELETQTKEAQEKLTKGKAGYQEQLRKTEETISQVTRLLKRSTEAELVRTGMSVDKLFQGLHEPLEISSFLDKKILNTLFLPSQEVFDILEKAKLGRLYKTAADVNQSSVEGVEDARAGLESQFQVITRNFEGKQCYCRGNNVTVEIMSAASGKAAADVQIDDKNDGSYTVSFIPREPRQHLVTVQVNGEKLKENSEIQVKERSFKLVRSIGEERIDDKYLFQPWGVAVNNLNEIFVTDLKNGRILVVTEKGQFLRSFGQNLVNEPTGISIDNEGRIFVANKASNKILLFDSNGKYVKTVNSAGSLLSPLGIRLDAQGNLVVCDSGNRCVRFFSVEGNNFKTIEMGQFKMPFDCVCYDDKIFVSDRDAHVVKVYNKEGKFLYQFGGYGARDGELCEPTGLAVDKSEHLLICCTYYYRVHVFTLDGKFVTRFGKCGTFLGNFSDRFCERPTSVAVLNSGRTVVCEFGYNRLHVFA